MIIRDLSKFSGANTYGQRKLIYPYPFTAAIQSEQLSSRRSLMILEK
jgi:hypothetical protein